MTVKECYELLSHGCWITQITSANGRKVSYEIHIPLVIGVGAAQYENRFGLALSEKLYDRLIGLYEFDLLSSTDKYGNIIDYYSLKKR